jgi:hypothetical protein
MDGLDLLSRGVCLFLEEKEVGVWRRAVRAFLEKGLMTAGLAMDFALIHNILISFFLKKEDLASFFLEQVGNCFIFMYDDQFLISRC